jgi:hypothetical protein
MRRMSPVRALVLALTALLPLGPLALLAGCPAPPPGVDDDDDDDDDSAADDDDSTPDDDDTSPSDDDDSTTHDDDDTPPLPPDSIRNFPSFASLRQNDWSGESVSIVGDLDADGYDDLVIGAPGGGEKEIGSDPGQVFLFFGSAAPAWTVGTPLTDADVSWEGTPNDDLGFQVIGPGDWNGDGYDDLVVSAPQHPQGNAQAGRLWIIPGRARSAWTLGPGSLTPEDHGDAIETLPEADNSKLGLGLGALGDVNGDGLPDFAANSPLWNANEGRVYVFFGRTDPITVLAASLADVKINPGCATCYGSVLGTSIAGIGDLSGDGIDDFALGAPAARPSDGTPLGRTYVLHGRQEWPATLTLEGDDVGPHADTVITGSTENSDLGMGLAGGDVDGDGLGDLLVGAPHNDDSPFDRGQLLLWYGRSGGLGASVDAADADQVIEGSEQLESVGYTPALGDLDGDGDLDLVIGCPESAGLGDPLARSGRIYIVFGDPETWVGDPQDFADGVWFGEEYPQWVGESVSMGGDVDGDGDADLLVGANKSSVYADRAGQSYLLLGGSDGGLEN